MPHAEKAVGTLKQYLINSHVVPIWTDGNPGWSESETTALVGGFIRTLDMLIMPESSGWYLPDTNIIKAHSSAGLGSPTIEKCPTGNFKTRAGCTLQLKIAAHPATLEPRSMPLAILVWYHPLRSSGKLEDTAPLHGPRSLKHQIRSVPFEWPKSGSITSVKSQRVIKSTVHRLPSRKFTVLLKGDLGNNSLQRASFVSISTSFRHAPTYHF